MRCEGEPHSERTVATLFSPHVYPGSLKVVLHFLAQSREVMNERLQREQMPSRAAFPQNQHSQQKQAEFYFFQRFLFIAPSE